MMNSEPSTKDLTSHLQFTPKGKTVGA